MKNRLSALGAVECFVVACVLAMSPRACNAQQQPPQQEQTSFKFVFGPGEAPDGFTKVLATDAYSAAKAYGFDFGSEPIGVERGGDDP